MERRATLFDSLEVKGVASKSSSMDPFLETLRSIALFIVISKVLVFTAMTLLILLTNDTIYSILMVDDTTVELLGAIFNTFKLLHCAVLIKSSIICFFGIYGFARMNRYSLSFYGMVLVIMCLWSIYFFILVNSRSEEDVIKSSLFKSFKESILSRKAIDVIQTKYKCCGSKEYNYSDVRVLPITCCTNITEEQIDCLPEMAFTRLCETNKTTMLSILRETDMVGIVTGVTISAFLLTCFEVFLVYYMLYRLTVMSSDNILRL